MLLSHFNRELNKTAIIFEFQGKSSSTLEKLSLDRTFPLSSSLLTVISRDFGFLLAYSNFMSSAKRKKKIFKRTCGPYCDFNRIKNAHCFQTKRGSNLPMILSGLVDRTAISIGKKTHTGFKPNAVQTFL